MYTFDGFPSCRFDFATKGILNATMGSGEYWRLKDAQGKQPGLIGWWPSKAVTFIDNHDTGTHAQTQDYTLSVAGQSDFC